jgi:hypothetical protein
MVRENRLPVKPVRGLLEGFADAHPALRKNNGERDRRYRWGSIEVF